MHQHLGHGHSIGDLTNQEKITLHKLLVETGLEMLSQTVTGQVGYSDVPTEHLFNIYDFRLKNLSSSSKIKSDLESLVSNMSKFKGSSIRFVITRNDTFKYLIFTDRKFNELLGHLESSSLK
ncbi:hypothetical protein SAMN05216167_1493 [Spirosoma endophyticum]|uniref:Uncharacterized protein n=1 Tax=Spirosoma endophyticum TaxID=662367 RepID=A0A1I2HWY6_9BACT|nr:hypothetical protein SAMN05216167_1493 [Spirosoma endophyticum]